MLKGVFQYNIGVIRLGDIGCNRCIVEAYCKHINGKNIAV